MVLDFLPVSFLTHVSPLLARASTLKHLTAHPPRLTSSTTTYTKWRPTLSGFSSSRCRKRTWTTAQPKKSLNSTMNAPERIDYRERQYASLRPSHRVALDAWRRSGCYSLLVLSTTIVCLSQTAGSSPPVGDLLLNDGSFGPA